MIRTEQKSGTTLDGRSELKIILEFIGTRRKTSSFRAGIQVYN